MTGITTLALPAIGVGAIIGGGLALFKKLLWWIYKIKQYKYFIISYK